MVGVWSGIGAGLGVLGSAYGMYKSAQEGKAMQSRIDRQEGDMDYIFRKNAGTDFLDSDVARSAVGLMQRQAKEQNDMMNNQVAATGGTAEAAVAGKAAVASKMDEAIARLAGYGSQYKQANEQNYLLNKGALVGQQNALSQMRQESWSNFGKNAGSLADTFARLDYGYDKED